MIIEIDNLSLPEVEVYASLTETQLRNRLEPEKGIFIAESPNVIKAALASGCEPLSVLTERQHLDGTAKDVVELVGRQTPVFTGERATLARLTGYELTRGVLCAMRRPKPLNVEQVCSGKRYIAVIDSVVNASNTGAIFRAAAALGIDGVLLTDGSSDPLNRRCVRVSMGTVFQVPWAVFEGQWTSVSMRLHELGFATVAMALRDDALPIDSPILRALERIAIVLGNEGDGLRTEVMDTCDHVAMIPMQNGVDSLNVAAAAAVAFWEIAREYG